jgi:hypothetical protein
MHLAQRLRALLTGAAGGAAAEPVADYRPGGRHSNDHANFRHISIAPTVDEAVSPHPPFLPLPTPGEAFLGDDPETQLMDRQFRLLRENLLAPLRDALAGEMELPPLFVMVEGVETHVQAEASHDFRPKVNMGPIGVKFQLRLLARTTLPSPGLLIRVPPAQML